jgi:SNF2 family DNA or RNA helicase
MESQRIYEQHLSPKQREAFELLSRDENLGGLAFWRVGTGKTRLAIAAALHALEQSSVKANMIAVVCRRAAFYDWRQEIATLQLNYETPEIEDLSSATEVFNLESFVLVSDGLLRNENTVATLQRLIDIDFLGGVIVDEGYLYCNPTSQRSKGLNKITRQLPTVVVSGSIMPARDLTQIYGQAVAAD